MSSLDRLLVLSPKAEDDFADIFQYSLETWGEAQANAYRDILDKALLAIQDNPQIGRGRPELSAQHLTIPRGAAHHRLPRHHSGNSGVKNFARAHGS